MNRFNLEPEMLFDETMELLFSTVEDMNSKYNSSIENAVNCIMQAVNTSREKSVDAFISEIFQLLDSFTIHTDLELQNAIEAAKELIGVTSNFQVDGYKCEEYVEDSVEDTTLFEKIESVASKYQVSLGLLMGLIAILVSIVLQFTPDKEMEEIKDNQQIIIANQEAELTQNEKIIELLTELRNNDEDSELVLKDFLKQLEDTLNVDVESVSDSQDSVSNFEDVSDQAVDACDLRPHKTLPDSEAKQPDKKTDENPSQ